MISTEDYYNAHFGLLLRRGKQLRKLYDEIAALLEIRLSNLQQGEDMTPI